MKSYQQILGQIEKLTAEAEKLRTRQASRALDQIMKLMGDYKLTLKDIASATKSGRSDTKKVSRESRKGPPRARKPVPAKYRSADGSKTWSGRGLKPKWLSEELDKGHQLSDFLIQI